MAQRYISDNSAPTSRQNLMQLCVNIKNEIGKIEA